MRELPDGWTEALLTDVAGQKKFSIVDGPFGSDLKLSDYAEDGAVPVLTTKNLTGSYDPASVRFISREKYDQLKRSRVVGGDILIAKIGSVGRCSIYPDGAPTAIIPANLCKITVDERVIHNRFLYWQIRSEAFQEKLRDITSATAQPAFSVQRLKTLSIALAPFGEQHRIVLKLEESLSKVEACQKGLAKIPVILKRFRQSVLSAACSGRLTADWRENKSGSNCDVLLITEDSFPDSWRTASVAEIANIGSGQSSALIISKCLGQGSVPWFKVSDMNSAGNEKVMLKGQNYLSQEDVSNLRMRIFPPGTLIFPKRGGAISTNKKRLLSEPSCIDSNTMALTPRGCLSEYFWTWFSTIDLATLSDGSNVPQINNTDILPLEVPLPPIAEQKEIVSRVEALFKLADQIEARYRKAQAQVDKLTQSILAKAFRGELVPTEAELASLEGRDYEPASILLERIRTGGSNRAPASPTARANRFQERRLSRGARRRK